MINYIKGTIVSKVENSPSGCNITVEVNNIGYLIVTNPKVVNKLSDVGDTVVVYTSLIHKEDQMYLCGFDCREDRDLFNILQTVSGIGVKVALTMLGEMTAAELVGTVISDDSKALSRIKGIGPKLAKRIILELKDKMTSWRNKIDFTCASEDYKTSSIVSSSIIEAESVLLSLGYSREEYKNAIEFAINKAINTKDTEEILRIALEWLANG
ncbi:MAG: Holliday junction branch migration protein RuvA [Candidatus Gastranaerophilaceae bacterium]|jgi:Holliday junction DNA helicase RuvA